jgi:TRAP transporter TAXI family solute receptor
MLSVNNPVDDLKGESQMKIKRFSLLITILCFILVFGTFLFFQSSGQSALGAEVDALKPGSVIAIGALTGTSVVIAQGLASKIQEKLGIRAVVTSGLPSSALVRLMITGDTLLTIAPPDTIGFAYRGEVFFADDGPQPVRSIQGTHKVTYILIARKNSGINSVNDLKGKRFMFSSKFMLAMNQFGRLLMKYKGWTEDDLKVLTLTRGQDAMTALRDRTTDAIVWAFGDKAPDLTELALTLSVKLVPLREDEQKFLLENNPYYMPSVIPAGMYKGQNDEVRSVGAQQELICLKNTSEDFIYSIAKIMLDSCPDCASPGDFTKFHPIGGSFTPSDMGERAKTTPLHTGAVRYLKEKGCWSPEIQKLHEELLAIRGEKN